MDQIPVPLILIYTYLSAYTHLFDYVHLHCYLHMHIWLCLWFLMFAYVTYVCLYMFIYLLIDYDISKGIFCWNYEVWRKGKYLVGILVLSRRGGSVYIRGLVLPLFCLSFLSSSYNILYYIQYNYILSLSLISSLLPPLSNLAKSIPLPYCEFPGL
jgi:hypothetical protein